MINNNNNNNNNKSTSCLYSSDSDNGSGSGGGGSDYFATNSNHTIVECPLSNDVIFRRGKTMNIHLGNLKFQNLIEAHVYEHTIDLDTSPIRRIEIEIELMNEVRKKLEKTNGCDSGRFLTWDVENSWWLVMQSDDEIQKKIHYAFRDFRKKMLKTKQQQQKVQTRTSSNLNSIFERQDGRQKKKRYNDNNNNNNNNITKNSSSSGDIYNGNSSESDDNNNICNIPMPFSLPSTNNNNNIGACGYFFSTDDGSYTNLDESR